MVRIYNPVDLQRMQGAANIGENPYDNSGPNIVAAGRLSWEKGFDVLLNAMPAVIKRLPGARLVILGEGPLHADLTKQALRLGINEAICCLGFQQDPWRYFKFADVFVLSSRFEGLPNVLLEALALGTPAIATNCTGALREIEACGAGMVLVPPEDPPALAEAIVSVCQKGSRQDLATPPETLHKFDLQQIVGEYSELLLS
jgi:glycosyltransferase involved in cell wall biosynthesis